MSWQLSGSPKKSRSLVLSMRLAEISSANMRSSSRVMTCALELARFLQVLYILIDSPGLSAIEMSARAKLSRRRGLSVRVGNRGTSAPSLSQNTQNKTKRPIDLLAFLAKIDNCDRAPTNSQAQHGLFCQPLLLPKKIVAGYFELA